MSQAPTRSPNRMMTRRLGKKGDQSSRSIYQKHKKSETSFELGKLEELRKQEEKKKKEEEEKRFHPQILSTGFDLALNEYFITLLASSGGSSQQREFFMGFFEEVLKHMKIFENFERIEITITVDFLFLAWNMIRESLRMTTVQNAIVINIFWRLIKNDDEKYKMSFQTLFKGSSVSPRSITQNKLYEKDLELFRFLLKKHSMDEEESNSKKFFDLSQVKTITEMAYMIYFRKFNLFKFLFDNKQKNEEFRIAVYVDIPMEVAPLKEAIFMGKPKLDIPMEGEDEEEIKIELAKKQMAEVEQARAEAEKKQQAEEKERMVSASKQAKKDPMMDFTESVVGSNLQNAMQSYSRILAEADSTVIKTLDEKLHPPKKGAKKN